jgi:RNA polymerase sigma factor (sigma-70 family)
MTPHSSQPGPRRPDGAQFAGTHWTSVLNAGRSDSTQARSAMERLCQAYWQPIYAFIRREGHGPEDAEDLTQEFFTRLLAKNFLRNVDPTKGRFRSFLLAAVKHFLANEYDKARAQKRGGGVSLIPIERAAAETSYRREPVETVTPDKLFERRWALTLLENVLKLLREEYTSQGKTALFEALKATLTGERSSLPYSELGSKLGMSEGAVKVAVHRLRQRYREILREEIAHTVASPPEIDEEIRALFAALGS